MRDHLKRWYPVLVAAVAAAVSLAVFPRLPAEMATHWDADGVANGWMPRAVGAFFVPVLVLALGAGLRVLPTIDPRRANYARFGGAYDLMVAVVLGFLLVVHCGIIAVALGHHVPVARAGAVLTGALFLLIGNVLPTLRSNFWFGIRTPWTLSDDRVWARTHRIAGFVVTAAGILMIAGGLLLPPRAGVGLVIAAAVAATFGPALYSYFTWKHHGTP